MGRKRGANYRAGSWWRSDDRSGFSVRAENTRQEWNSLIVAEDLWEPRQPQDLVKGVADDQTVPLPRPVPPAIWDGPLYFQLTQTASIGAVFLYLQYIAGISDGDAVGIMMNNGEFFNTTVSGDPVSLGIYISTPLPVVAASGNMVVDYGLSGPSSSTNDFNYRVTQDGRIRVTMSGNVRATLP